MKCKWEYDDQTEEENPFHNRDRIIFFHQGLDEHKIEGPGGRIDENEQVAEHGS